jgi:hypothetical protein
MAAVRLNARAFVRFLASVCATVLLFGDVARGVHLLTEHHVVCAAHGELVEAAETSAPSAHDGTDGAAALPAPGVDAHEHCSMSAAPSRVHATEVASALFVSVAVPLTSIGSCPELPFEYGVGALTYAPKQGPPV